MCKQPNKNCLFNFYLTVICFLRHWLSSVWKIAIIRKPDPRAFSIRPKTRDFSKRREMVRTFPGKIPVKSENFGISEIMRTLIRPKSHEFLVAKANGTKISGNKLSKFWAYLTRLSSSSCLEIPENTVPFAAENVQESKPEFLAKRKAPQELGNFVS